MMLSFEIVDLFDIDSLANSFKKFNENLAAN